MKTSEKGMRLIKFYEGLRLDAYLCPANVWTIGYGHTYGVKKGDKLASEKDASDLLGRDLASFERGVLSMVSVPLTQGQFDALVSFAYNLGTGALRGSTLLKKLNSGDYAGAAGEFGRWVNAGGKKLQGLVKRRDHERELFASD